MITAVDSSVLLDIILDDPRYRVASMDSLREARAQGALIVCPVVWAEVRAALTDPDSIREVLGRVDISFDVFDRETSDLAGDLWREYRRQGGKRQKLIPDFLVGAHAMIRAKRILSRDRGFLRRYFKKLSVIDPTAKNATH
jgi:predicted nucleic acid-binding protein